MTESTTSNMDNVQHKHEEIGTCFCEDCHHSRMERIQKERKQLQANRYILQNTNYGHIQYVHHVTMERTYELSIQPVTAIKVQTNIHKLQLTTVYDAKGQDIDDVHIEETEDFDNSEWSDTESVKSLGTMTYSENESGFFGSLSDLSGITEIPNDCEDQKYKLLQDELDRWRNKELKNDKLEIENEWYDTGNIYQEISLLKQSFYNKLSRTQKYIAHLKRENEKQIIQYETDMQCLHYEYQNLEEDYEMLNQEHNNCVTWDDYFDVVQQEYQGKIDELEKDLALEKTKNENLQQRIGYP